MKIGSKIKKLRELKGLSQENIAEELEMSTTGYGRIERDEVDVTLDKLNRISGILGMRVEDIINFDEKIVFNNYDNTKIEKQIGNYNMPDEMKQLYEENIKLLKQRIEYLEKELKKYEQKT